MVMPVVAMIVAVVRRDHTTIELMSCCRMKIYKNLGLRIFIEEKRELMFVFSLEYYEVVNLSSIKVVEAAYT